MYLGVVKGCERCKEWGISGAKLSQLLFFSFPGTERKVLLTDVYGVEWKGKALAPEPESD